MGELYLVRHGQASFGADDYDRLSPLGLQQAAWLGEAFRAQGLEVARLACGSLRRQRETAAAIADAMGLRRAAEILPGLDEYDGDAILAAHRRVSGAAAPDRSDRRTFFRALRAALEAWTRGDLDPDGGCESWAGFSGRVEAARRALSGADRAERVLAVSSGGPISHIVAATLGAPAEAMVPLNLQMRNTGVTRFAIGGRGVHLSCFNGTGHLEAPERAGAITYA